MSSRHRPIRILCFSDTHGKPPPENDDGGVGAWLFAGDVYEQTSAFDQTEAQRAIRSWLDSCNIPLYAVRGNHDKADPAGFFDDSHDVTGEVHKIAEGLWVAGVGWCGQGPYDTPAEADLKRVCDLVRAQAIRCMGPADRLVLLSHYLASLPGLFPIAGYAAGGISECVRELIEELKPVAVVQGHVHEWFGTSAVFAHRGGSVLIVNPGPNGAVLVLGSGGSPPSCEFSPPGADQ